MTNQIPAVTTIVNKWGTDILHQTIYVDKDTAWDGFPDDVNNIREDWGLERLPQDDDREAYVNWLQSEGLAWFILEAGER